MDVIDGLGRVLSLQPGAIQAQGEDGGAQAHHRRADEGGAAETPHAHGEALGHAAAPAPGQDHHGPGVGEGTLWIDGLGPGRAEPAAVAASHPGIGAGFADEAAHDRSGHSRVAAAVGAHIQNQAGRVAHLGKGLIKAFGHGVVGEAADGDITRPVVQSPPFHVGPGRGLPQGQHDVAGRLTGACDPIAARLSAKARRRPVQGIGLRRRIGRRQTFRGQVPHQGLDRPPVDALDHIA
ncbi:hypothetical protein D3C80_858020 [compost metagenome]